MKLFQCKVVVMHTNHFYGQVEENLAEGLSQKYTNRWVSKKLLMFPVRTTECKEAKAVAW